MNKAIALNVIQIAYSQMSASTKRLVNFPTIKSHVDNGGDINDIIDIFTKSMSQQVDSVAGIILLQESLWIVKVLNDFKCGNYTMLERFVLNQYDPSLKPNARTVHDIRHPGGTIY
jgi:hypothetical protein